TAFPWLAGVHRAGDGVAPAHAAALGDALARIHAAPPFSVRRDSRYAFPRIAERLAGIPSPPAELTDEVAWLAGARAPLPEGIIHGDLFPDNVLYDGDRLVALLDFEQASDGAPAYDLAVTVLAWCFDDDFV